MSERKSAPSLPLRSWARLANTDTAHFLVGTSGGPQGRRRYTACGRWIPADEFRAVDKREAERYEVLGCVACEDAALQDIFGREFDW